MGLATFRACAVAFVFFIGAGLAAADDAAPLGQPITDPAEITAHMAGNTLSGVLKETGESWVEFYCDTGRSLYQFGDIALGKWWTESGKVCFAYEYNDYRFPRCFEMFGRADGSLAFLGHDDSGQPMTFLSAPPVPGDPFHLEQRAVHGCALEPSV
ncbi:hypothetical protein [Dongia sedimenti]|uniref:Uncharacterized protein n=1 Tax=Dongia sedimenti TaxID=3064282 RepID=A0ABU0YR96_9PROT|nr:hypothetical protein [Rhodospirillaceae bacterium R-7]